MKTVRRAGKRALLPIFASALLPLSLPAAASEQERLKQPIEVTAKALGEDRRLITVGSTAQLIHGDGSYQSRRANGTFSRLKQASPLLQLRGGRSFDPLQAGEFIRAQSAAGPAPDLFVGTETKTVGAYIVQFYTQALPDYQAALRQAGADIAIGLPPNAIIALMGTGARAEVAGLPFVRAVVSFLPAYKLQSGLDKVIASGGHDRQNYSVMSMTKSHRAALINFTASIGGEVVATGAPEGAAGSSRFSANLTPAQLLQLSRQPQTLFIDVRGEEGEDLDQIRQREGFNYIQTVAGYSGQGVGLEIYDRGYLLSHQEFAGRAVPLIVRSPAAADASGGSGGAKYNHGSDIAGILFAEGVAQAPGLLKDAARPIVFSRFSEYGSQAQPTESQLRAHLAELVDPAGPYRAVVQTSSTDYSTTTDYTTWSAEYDEVLFELDLLKTQSQSNRGNRNSRPAAWAKNIVAVGGLSTAGTVDRTDDSWGSASIGPASDNRIKPDLTGQYGGIYTVDGGPGSDTAYRNFGGTSGSTPVVAGAFGIFFQMWADGVFSGGPGLARDVFDSRPHTATARAMLINTAYRYAFSGGDSANLSRVHQGWGFPDLQNLYDTAQANGWAMPILIDEDDILAPGALNSYGLEVDGSEPIKATMVYRDPRGNPAAAIHRINDLSLRVTSPSGTRYWGNNGLRAGNWSTPGGSANTVDTIENVFIQAPEAGSWRIDVLGDDIVEDGHVGTAAIDAVYALVVTGGSAGPVQNQPPVVDAGADTRTAVGVALTLNGAVSDDGLPASPGMVTVSWSVLSGPGSVTFGDAGAAITEATFAVAGTYVLRLTANDGEAAVSDDIVVSVGVEPVILEAEGFEAGFGNWVNLSSGDNYDWRRDANGTPSNNTGPDTGNGSTWYLYLETSSSNGAFNAGDSAILESPDISAASNRRLSFYYHMYGDNMGTLYVDVNSGGTWDSGVWSISGQQQASSGAAYLRADIDLSAYTGLIKVRLRAVAAGGWRGDMAIDDIEISGN